MEGAGTRSRHIRPLPTHKHPGGEYVITTQPYGASFEDLYEICDFCRYHKLRVDIDGCHSWTLRTNNNYFVHTFWLTSVVLLFKTPLVELYQIIEELFLRTVVLSPVSTTSVLFSLTV